MKRYQKYKNNTGLQKLITAFEMANESNLVETDNISKEEHHFSKKYLNGIKKLSKKQRHFYWPCVNTFGKKVVATLVVLILLFGCSMTLGAVRKPVIGFFVNVFEHFSELFVNKADTENSPRKIEEIYFLTGLPKEFEKIKCSVRDNIVETTWSDGKTEIELSQHLLTGKFTIDNEDAKLFHLFVNDIEVVYYFSEKFGVHITQAFWNTNGYSFELYCSKHYSENEIIEFVNSLEKNNE